MLNRSIFTARRKFPSTVSKSRFHYTAMSSPPSVVSSAEMSTTDSKWITLKKINYLDADGNERIWECAERKTRKSSGVDGIAVLALLRSKTNSFPLSTVIIEQYRPPINKFIVELPAGLVDEGETPEQAAMRELEEETGYTAQTILDVSQLLVSDPGMTNANMKLVTIGVELPDQMETPEQQLEPGEFIVKRVVELSKLYDCLKEYSQKGFVVDARLSHFATGYNMAKQLSGQGYNY